MDQRLEYGQTAQNRALKKEVQDGRAFFNFDAMIRLNRDRRPRVPASIT